jgi:probable F420-dependent oxidoreductase
MRFALQLPTDRVQLGAEFGTGQAVIEMARISEECGFHAVSVTEHPIPEDEWMRTGGHHALDPFVALSFAAAATQELQLLTNLCVVPYRSPYLTAKVVASLDSLSGGRLIFGCGAGYLEPEFRALGVDFARRNELFDDALREMKRVWGGSSLAIGEHQHHALPRPAQSPHPPIWIGGNSQRAMRRAVELGDGWMPILNFPQHVARRRTPVITGPADLAKRLDELRAHAQRIGKPAPRDIAFMAMAGGVYGRPGFDAGARRAELAQLEAIGVTWMHVSFDAENRFAWLALAESFARDFI